MDRDKGGVANATSSPSSRHAGCRARAHGFAALRARGPLAHTAQLSSSHTLAFARGSTGDVFSGQVSSDLAACTDKRSITLYRVATEAGSADAAVATTSTDSSGAWSTTFTQATGDYYAVAVEIVLPTRRQHDHTCMAATSNVVTAPPPDGDGDGVYDASDNCPNTANADQKDTDGDGYRDVCDPDGDGDGYTSSQGDCNDLQATVNPGATELANGIDDDCDGVIDEGFGATQTCWVPSSEPITAVTTWSQVEVAGACSWWMRVYSSTSPDSVFLNSVDWMKRVSGGHRGAAGQVPVRREVVDLLRDVSERGRLHVRRLV